MSDVIGAWRKFYDFTSVPKWPVMKKSSATIYNIYVCGMRHIWIEEGVILCDMYVKEQSQCIQMSLVQTWRYLHLITFLGLICICRVFFCWEKGATALWIWPVVSDNGSDFNRLKPPKAVAHRKTCNYSPGLTSFESKLAAAYARQIAMSHMFVCSISKTPKSIEYSVITWLNEFPLPGFTMGCSVMGMY